MMQKNRLPAIPLLSVLFIVLLSSDPAIAFKRETRCQILKDAIYFSPTELKVFLMNNFEVIHEGIHYADRNEIPDRMIRKATQTYYTNLVQLLKDNRMDEDFTVRSFGLLACHIAETISPDRYITASALTPNKVKYYGHNRVADIEPRIAMLIKKYRKPYRGNQHYKVTNFLYVVAVNEIVNQWTSAWQAAGKKPGKFKPKGTILSRKLPPVINFNSRFR